MISWVGVASVQSRHPFICRAMHRPLLTSSRSECSEPKRGPSPHRHLVLYNTSTDTWFVMNEGRQKFVTDYTYNYGYFIATQTFLPKVIIYLWWKRFLGRFCMESGMLKSAICMYVPFPRWCAAQLSEICL